MHASTSKSLFSPTSCKLYQSQLPLACFCFCWFRVYTRSGRLRASKPMGCKKLWRKSITLATTLRRCGDAIWWKFGKKQSYTHGFCHGNMRTREAGWKVDHRLTAFQLNVSLVFFSISSLLSWAWRRVLLKKNRDDVRRNSLEVTAMRRGSGKPFSFTF